MKTLSNLILIFFLTGGVFAQPINYQGRLSDKSGTSVSGTKNFSLRIFDAKTGGKQIYEETIGAVTVNEGAYSFNFGENGKSVVTPTETIAFADGEKQIFNYTVKNTPVLGGIKISSGEYSWTEAGSSDAGNFTATANKNSGAISAIFLTGAPGNGEEIAIEYDHSSDGVMGALSRGGQSWLEITVGGETLSPRERLVSVPYALRAGVAESITNKPERILFNISRMSLSSQGWMKSGFGPYGVWFPNLSRLDDSHLAIGLYVPKDAQKLILRFNDGVMNYSSSSDGSGKVTIIPGIPKIEASISNSGSNINEPEAIFRKIGKHEFHLENPPSGWKQIAFMVKPLSDYGRDHYFLSLNNKLVILVK